MTPQEVRGLEVRQLQEVSPGVTFPAYPQTDFALASMRRWLDGANGRAGRDPADDMRWRRHRLRELKLLSQRGA